MKIKIIHDPNIVYEFLKDKIRFNYIYQFSDLTSEKWADVICYGLYENSELKQIAMVMINEKIPVLLAACFENVKYNIELIRGIKQYLPSKFYTHIDNETLKRVFLQKYIFELEEYMNMGLCDFNKLEKIKKDEPIRLGFDKINDIKSLIKAGHPDAWLNDDLVKINENFGLYQGEKLISFTGIHAYSKDYEVAAVAHVTTHPDYRNKGYASKVVAALSDSLRRKIKYVGLNVKIDNLPAISCYKKLGFEGFGRFIACEVQNKL